MSIADPVSRLQVETLDGNCDDFGILDVLGLVHGVGSGSLGVNGTSRVAH